MRARSLFLGLAVGALATPARAEPTTLGLHRLGAPAVAAFAPSHRALVTLPTHLDPRAFGLVPIVPGIAVIEGTPARLAGFSAAHPDFLVELRPPLRPKLDAAVPFIRATPADIGTARGGEGVIIGIIDTGVDLSLDDFRNEDGTTRALFYLDGAATTYGTLDEAAYLGRIYDKATIDARLAGAAILPGDENGHGTHVAGIAVGNGGKPPARYFGVAPAADLIVVRAGSADGNLDEGKILAGAKFVFDMAKKLGKPAVVNLSLGTQFGAHDGTSALERSLSALAQGPGRAVVVAASNEAQAAIHTSVRIQKTGRYEIPIRLPGSDGAGAKYTSGSVYAWINARTGSFKVSVKGEGKDWLAPVEPGQGFGAQPRPDLSVNVVNDIQNGKPLPEGSHGAVMVVRGALPVGDLTLVIEGDASAELWLQGDGQASDGPGAAFFPHGAQLEGTIGVPASAAGLIAIGCVDHRTSYADRLGRSQHIGDVLIGRRCAFSSAGPNALGQPRPDVLAPGNFVISTLAHAVTSFDARALVDPDHVALAGTSMSSPVGAGAVALLFQRDPTLTHEDARALLVAGARPLVDDTGTGAQDYAKGAGVLDLRGAFAALARRTASTTAPASLQLRLGGSFVTSDGSMPLYGLALVRDAEGLPTDLPGLRLELDGALVARDALVRVAAGAYRFSVVAAPGHGLERTTLTLRGGNLVATRVLALGPDGWDARDGMKVGGGCGHAGGAAGGPGALLLVAWVLLLRRHSAAKIPTS
ncbi:MAG: S8 family serine peptidase [Myxococcales bacterium]|nr:S8 family serine peptidase [Myxococcales bacterium]